MKLLRVFIPLLVAPIALAAQDPAVAYPQNYKLVIDNADFTVLRVHYGPHEKVGVHDHSDHSTVYVYLNDSGPVRFQHSEEAKPFDVVRPPTHTGAFRVSPGRIETHAVENLSDLPSDYLRVELKRLPVKSLPDEFRGAAPTPPLVPGTTVLYDNPKLRVERMVIDAESSHPSVPAIDRDAIVITVDVPGRHRDAEYWAQEYRSESRLDSVAAFVPAGVVFPMTPQAEAKGMIEILRVSVPATSH